MLRTFQNFKRDEGNLILRGRMIQKLSTMTEKTHILGPIKCRALADGTCSMLFQAD